MGLTKKIIKCTITFVKNPDFTCDLWIWQNIPNDLGIYRGYFERIKNHKRLQIEANEGTWQQSEAQMHESDMLLFFKNSAKPSEPWTHFISLGSIPFDFIDQVIAGKELNGTNPYSGVLYKPVSFLHWRLWC